MNKEIFMLEVILCFSATAIPFTIHLQLFLILFIVGYIIAVYRFFTKKQTGFCFHILIPPPKLSFLICLSKEDRI